MKKSLLLILLSIFSFATIHAEITWTLSDDGTLTISGTNMPDYFDNTPWSYRQDEINNVVIREGVTNISCYAFSGCWALNSIYIPNTVTSIGDHAFYFCSALQSITIPKSVTSIGKEAFYYCPSLTSIIVEEGNATYDSRYNCNAIIETKSNTLVKGCRTTVIPNSIINIGNNAFEGCTGLTSISIPNSVTSIGEGAFYNCSDLLSIIFPNSLTSIESSAFGYCQNITSVTIPKFVKSIAGNAFYGCSRLTSIAVENGNTTYDSRNNCNAIIDKKNNTMVIGCKNTIIPNTVTSIGDYAFANCSNLKSISIPNSVSAIGNSAFLGCNGLTSINIPNSVISIGAQAFSNCNFTSISIPNSVTSIGVGAFSDCEYLESITIPNSVTEIGESAFASTKWYNKQPDGLIYINSILYKYKGTMHANSSVIIKEGTTKIVDNAFEGCHGLISATIPNSLTSIGYGAFKFCTGLASITIPNSVTNIGDYAFWQCTSLSSVNIPNSITYIGEGVFSGCYSLSSIVIPNTITSIGNSTFYECSSLTSITIPNSVKSIGRGAFQGCTSLTSITVPNSITSIGNYAFSECVGLTSINIPNSITSIGNGVFYGCSGLISISIPGSVKSIGESTFGGCSGLTSITIPNSVTSIGNRAFTNCTGLTAITIGNSVTNIGKYAFCSCKALTSITIPNSVTSIGEYAFSWCSALTSITIPKSVTNIESNAFFNCFNLKEFTIYANKNLKIESMILSSCNTLASIKMRGEAIPASVKDLGVDYNSVVLYVPSDLYGDYTTTLPWTKFTNIITKSEIINLSDGVTYENASRRNVQEISYTRTFNNTAWQALYIPFSLNYADWKDDFEVAYINGVRQLDKDDNGTIDETIMDVIKIKSGATTPNMPYLIKAKTTGKKTFSVNDATLYPAEENSVDCSTTIAKYTFTGTYNTISSATMIANNYYGMGGGELVQSDGSNDLMPYRWYMNVESRNPSYNTSNAAKTITINVIGDEEEMTTGIRQLQITNDELPVYDLNGRKVNENNLKPGIYVKNGKKFVVK